LDVPARQPQCCEQRTNVLACRTAALEDIRGDTDLPNYQLHALDRKSQLTFIRNSPIVVQIRIGYPQRWSWGTIIHLLLV